MRFLWILGVILVLGTGCTSREKTRPELYYIDETRQAYICLHQHVYNANARVPIYDAEGKPMKCEDWTSVRVLKDVRRM